MTLKTHTSYHGAFALGCLTLLWVGASFVGGSVTALLMTVAMAVVLCTGAWELHRFRADSQVLATAVAQQAQAPVELPVWLAQLPATMTTAVRLRVEGERVALPAPVLAPYLVGLLVMLGMLGTFVGMVMTFSGAVGALEGSADLLAIRAALAAPIKGLSLSFGTSVAGVASSAALGWMFVLARRERLDVGRRLDAMAQTLFAVHTPAHHRREMLAAVQQQSAAWPLLVDRLQALADSLDRRDAHTQAQWLEQQQRFQQQVHTAYTQLADDVGRSLRESLSAATRAAGEALQAPVQALIHDVTELTQRQQQAQSQALQQQQAAWVQALDSQVTGLLHQWHNGMAQHQQRLDEGDEQRSQWLAQLQQWQTALQADAQQQRDQWQLAGQQWETRLTTQAAQAEALTERMAHSANQLGALSANFDQGVQRFGESSQRLLAALERVDGALQQSMERSDEQLAYYVGQAREVIDLCLASQQRVVEDLQRLRQHEAQARQPRETV